MHLSSEEVGTKVYARCDTVEDFEWWEATFRRPGTLVHRDERATKTKAPDCDTCGRAWQQATVHPALGQHTDGCPCYVSPEDRWPE